MYHYYSTAALQQESFRSHKKILSGATNHIKSFKICTISIHSSITAGNLVHKIQVLSGATNHIKSFKICTIPIQQQDYSRKFSSQKGTIFWQIT